MVDDKEYVYLYRSVDIPCGSHLEHHLIKYKFTLIVIDHAP